MTNKGVAIAVGGVLGLGLLLALACRKKPTLAPVDAPAEAPAEAPEQAHSGLAMVNGTIRVQDFNLWMAWAPAELENALSRGYTDPATIAASIFSRALPDYVFPPQPGFPGYVQWPELIDTIAKMLDLQPEPPGLRVVS